MFRFNRVKIIKSDDRWWYKDYINEWFDVKEYKNESVFSYDLVKTQNNRDILKTTDIRNRIIMKEDCVTKLQLREKKFKRILK